MSLSAEELLLILEDRYDYYSARAMLTKTARAAGLGAKGPFDSKALGRLADVLVEIGDRVDQVVAQLREAAKATPAKPAPAKPAAGRAAPKKSAPR